MPEKEQARFRIEGATGEGRGGREAAGGLAEAAEGLIGVAANERSIGIGDGDDRPQAVLVVVAGDGAAI